MKKKFIGLFTLVFFLGTAVYANAASSVVKVSSQNATKDVVKNGNAKGNQVKLIALNNENEKKSEVTRNVNNGQHPFVSLNDTVKQKNKEKGDTLNRQDTTKNDTTQKKKSQKLY